MEDNGNLIDEIRNALSERYMGWHPYAVIDFHIAVIHPNDEECHHL